MEYRKQLSSELYIKKYQNTSKPKYCYQNKNAYVFSLKNLLNDFFKASLHDHLDTEKAEEYIGWRFFFIIRMKKKIKMKTLV